VAVVLQPERSCGVAVCIRKRLHRRHDQCARLREPDRGRGAPRTNYIAGRRSSRDTQWSRLELALDHILKHADPAGYMINRVVEVGSAKGIRVREIPPGKAGDS